MRKTIHIVSILAGLLMAGSVAPAAPELKLATVDLGRAFNNYWKTRDNQTKLQARQQRMKEEMEVIEKEFNTMVEDWKAKVDEAESDILSQEARERARAEAQRKAGLLEEKRQQAQQFVTNNERILASSQKTQQEILLGEVRKVVVDIGRANGATVIVDTSGPTVFGVPTVLYADAGFDITEDVVTELNKSMPADFEKSAPAPKPAE